MTWVKAVSNKEIWYQGGWLFQPGEWEDYIIWRILMCDAGGEG